MPTPPKKIQADPPRPKPNLRYDENDVYNVAFKARMVPSDSMEDSVQKNGKIPMDLASELEKT